MQHNLSLGDSRDSPNDTAENQPSPRNFSASHNDAEGAHSQPMSPQLDFKQSQFKREFMIESEPHTPIEQIPPPAFSTFDTKHRFGSVSSIATTDDEDMGTNEILYPWNEQQDQLVKSMYEDMLNSPQLTPFSGRYPPSGILHRVAKDTLRMAKHKKIYFPHSMNAVRQRVIHLYHTEPETREELQQYRVPRDYFSESLESDPSAADSEDFDFTDVIGPSGRRLSVEEKYGNRLAGLQPAFKEPSQQAMTEGEAIVNIVAKRKRDSLRMKRGLH